MKKILIVPSFLMALAAPAFSEPLFNGKDLTGWAPKGADVWTFEKDVLTGKSNSKKQGSVLWSEAKFKDFTLDLDFRFSGDVDSGVFLRTENDQIQIGTSRSLKRDMTGSPYIGTIGKYPVEAHDVKSLLKEGEWNHFSITAKGGHYVVLLNGKQVLDYTSDTAAKEGPIGLQVHPGVDMMIEFKNVDLVKG
ncbi:DUF1080 domain-containing protein [Luteolibacter ambystomatis]|uniref:DUF1080 domain-containing protein n=1 Tax=Luteolibacter ambystomatis TaxID=2824561 RepID=A0A975G8Y7_9BACT|nr:DUF1080 domain-containing protein [Luteolibacter ambystomatis]QUE51007.1 DUF1080 domain-containing protein [Luteolibacter ambystomatis]